MALGPVRSLYFVRAAADRPPLCGWGAPGRWLGRRKIAPRGQAGPGGDYEARHFGEGEAQATGLVGAGPSPLGGAVAGWTRWSPESGPTKPVSPMMRMASLLCHGPSRC